MERKRGYEFIFIELRLTEQVTVQNCNIEGKGGKKQ